MDILGCEKQNHPEMVGLVLVLPCFIYSKSMLPRSFMWMNCHPWLRWFFSNWHHLEGSTVQQFNMTFGRIPQGLMFSKHRELHGKTHPYIHHESTELVLAGPHVFRHILPQVLAGYPATTSHHGALVALRGGQSGLATGNTIFWICSSMKITRFSSLRISVPEIYSTSWWISMD